MSGVNGNYLNVSLHILITQTVDPKTSEPCSYPSVVVPSRVFPVPGTREPSQRRLEYLWWLVSILFPLVGSLLSYDVLVHRLLTSIVYPFPPKSSLRLSFYELALSGSWRTLSTPLPFRDRPKVSNLPSTLLYRCRSEDQSWFSFVFGSQSGLNRSGVVSFSPPVFTPHEVSGVTDREHFGGVVDDGNEKEKRNPKVR